MNTPSEFGPYVIGRGRALPEKRVPLAFAGQSIIVGVEVGVWRAYLSAYWLAHIPHLYLHMVDRWLSVPRTSSYVQSGDKIAAKPQRHFDNCKCDAIENTRFAETRRFIHHTESTEAAKRFQPGSVDFVFIDGDHSFAGVTADLDAWWSVLRVGGQLGGHDLDAPEIGFKVRDALEAFIARTCPGTPFDLCGFTSWWMTKPAPSPT